MVVVLQRTKKIPCIAGTRRGPFLPTQLTVNLPIYISSSDNYVATARRGHVVSGNMEVCIIASIQTSRAETTDFPVLSSLAAVTDRL